MAIVVPIISSFDAKGINKAMRDFKKLESSGDKLAYGLLNVNKGVNSLGKSLGKLTAIGGGIAGVIGGNLVAAAYESQKVLKQTDAIITATGSAAGMTAKDVQKLADSLSMKTGIDDEAIQTSLNMLLTFKQVRNEAGKGNDVFNRASMAMLDLANVFGSSDAAAKMLGKALSDPVKGVTALQRAGVNFSAQQREQIKSLVDTGKVLEAQKLILAEVESQVGGTAAAGATAFDKMKVAVGNVQETLGGLLLPYVEQLATYVATNVIPIFERFADVVGKNGVGAGINYLIGSVISGIWNMGKLGKTIMIVAGAVTALKVATVTYRSAMVAMNVVTTLSNGALKELIVKLGQTKIAMMAAGGVTALLATAAAIYGAYASQKAEATNRTKDFVEALKMEGDAQIEALAALYKSDPAFKQSMDTLAQYGKTVGDLSGYVAGNAGQIKNWDDAIRSVLGDAIKIDQITASANPNIDTQAQLYDALRQKLPALRTATVAQIDAFLKMIGTFRGMRTETAETQKVIDLFTKALGVTTNTGGGKVETLAQKFAKAKTAVKSLFDTQKQLQAATKSTASAQAGLQTATDKLAVAQYKLNMIAKGYGAGSQEAVDAQKALTQAQNESTRAGYDLQKARFAVTDAEAELAKARMRGNPRDIAEAEIALGEANLSLADAQTSLDDKTKAVTTAQQALNETVSGATTTSQTYLDALKDVTDAQAEQVTAIDNVRTAKERELDVTRNLVKAQILLRKAKGGLTKDQKASLDKMLVDLNKPVTVTVPTATPGIVPMATGGIVTKPTLALVGEAGAEAVIPLTGNTASSMGNNTTIHVTVTSADPNAVVDALRRYQRQNGAIPVRTAA